MIVLEIEDFSTGQKMTQTFEGPQITIGKADDCDLPLARPNISRRHTRISDRKGTLIVEDMNSTNGTYVNGARIPGPTLLTPQDEIRLGDFIVHAFIQAPKLDDTIISGPEAPDAGAGLEATVILDDGPAPPPPPVAPTPQPVRTSPAAATVRTGPASPPTLKDPPKARKEEPKPEPPPPPKKEEPKKDKEKDKEKDKDRADDAMAKKKAKEDSKAKALAGGEVSEEDMFDRDIMFMQTVRNFLVDAAKYLDDPGVSELMINGYDMIYIERGGKIELTGIQFRNEDQLMSLVRNIGQYVGRRISEDEPYMDARLPDGSRVAILIRPCSRVGPSLSIRKFSRKRLGVDDLIKWGALTEDAKTLMHACVILKKNVLVSGGTGSGKTTLLNIVSGLIPPDERIIVIEDASELQLQQEHVLPWETKAPDKEGKGAVHIRDLVKASLRFRPDRIVVGECRGGEALDLLQAMNTGHSGSMATVHASSPKQTLSRIETLALFAGLDIPIVAMRSQVASAIEIVFQTARLRDGSRKVTHISEVLPLDDRGQYATQDLLRFHQTGLDENGKVLGRMEKTGKIPTFISAFKANGLDITKDWFLEGAVKMDDADVAFGH